MAFYKRKPILASFIIIALGIIIASGIFVYYGFHLGIKPCKGLPSDADNCGDADFGGFYFILIGALVIVSGLVSLLDSFIDRRNRR